MANYDFSATSTPAAEAADSSWQSDPSFPRPSGPAAASQSPLPPAFLSVPNIYNFRTLGIHRLPQQERLRTDLLYRSAEPSPVTDAGIAVIEKLGITTVYDLRSPTEIERNKAHTPIVDIPGTKRVAVPVFANATPDDHSRRMGYYGRAGTSGFVEAYAEILIVGKPAYRAIFEHLRDRPREAALVHCTAGKDRTGVVVALVLSLAGVGDEAIAEEYSLTELGLAAWQPTIVEHILRDPAMGGDRGKVERMVGAKAENMTAFLERMREDWGGVEGYLVKGLEFSEADVEKVRANITEADE